MGQYVLIDGRIYDRNELAHHGIKGMKWGVRRFQTKDGSLTPAGKKRYAAELDDKKASYESAKKARSTARVNRAVAKKQYDSAFNDAYNYSQRHTISQFTNKTKRGISDKLWEEVHDKANSSSEARAAYKQANKDYKKAKRDYREAKTDAKFEKYGLDPTNPDHIVNAYSYGFKGAQRIQKRMDKYNMSDLKASTIETGRYAATSVLASVGTIAAIGAISKYANPTGQILDASGKVIKNLYK